MPITTRKSGNRKINMTENTTASGAADLPEFPGHPEPHNMMWTALEIVAIRKYGEDMFRAGRLAASAPVAPAPQPAAPKKKPLPDLMMAAYHEAIGWNACVDAMNVAAAPKAAPGDALDEAMRERDDAEDFIDELLDEVLGADRPEWSSAYNRYDAMNDVRERITALHKPAVDKAWGQFQSTKAAPQQAAPASNESAYQRGYMDGMAKSRRDAGAAPQQEAQEPVASVHRDTLAMLNSGQVRPWDGGARLHPPSKARFDTAYAPLYAAPPTAPADRIDLHQALTEPVAWLVYLPSEDAQRIYDSQDDIGYVDDLTNNADAKVIPLYTAQPSAAAAAKAPAAPTHAGSMAAQPASKEQAMTEPTELLPFRSNP